MFILKSDLSLDSFSGFFSIKVLPVLRKLPWLVSITNVNFSDSQTSDWDVFEMSCLILFIFFLCFSCLLNCLCCLKALKLFRFLLIELLLSFFSQFNNFDWHNENRFEIAITITANIKNISHLEKGTCCWLFATLTDNIWLE